MSRRRRCRKCGADVGSPDFDLCGACCKPRPTGYVLWDGQQFWGQRWEIYNSSLRRPRHGLGLLNDDPAFKVRLCYGLQEATWEHRQARELCGLNLQLKAVEFSGERQDTRILLRKGG